MDSDLEGMNVKPRFGLLSKKLFLCSGVPFLGLGEMRHTMRRLKRMEH